MMKLFITVSVFSSTLFAAICFAQIPSEANEITPEELDAAYSAEDAAREAASWSSTIMPRDERTALERMNDEADLIFRGTVDSQVVVYNDKDIPFTHTIFAVTDLIKGEAEPGIFTLVQEGGPDRDDPGKVLLVSTSSYFQVGEEELLYIGFSRTTGADIVQQRFRILQGNMYNENGRGVIVRHRAADNTLRLDLTPGRSPDKRFRKVPIGTGALYKHFGADKSGEDSGAESSAKTVAQPSSAGANHVGASVGDFIAAVERPRRAQR